MPIPLERSQANVIRLHPIQGKMKDASKLPRQVGSVSITPPRCSQIWGVLCLIINGLSRFLYKAFFIFPFFFFFKSRQPVMFVSGRKQRMSWDGLVWGGNMVRAAAHSCIPPSCAISQPQITAEEPWGWRWWPSPAVVAGPEVWALWSL